MIILCGVDLVGKGYGDVHLALILRLVVTVTGLDLGFPMLNGGQSVFTDKLRDVVYNAIGIVEGGCLKGSAGLIAEYKFNARVDNRLTLHYIEKIFGLNVYVGKYLEVRLPCDFGACVAL